MRRIKNTYLTSHAVGGLLHEKSIEAELKGSRLFYIIEHGSAPQEFPFLGGLTTDDAKNLVTELIDGLINLGLTSSYYLVAIDQALHYRKYYRIAHPAPYYALLFFKREHVQDSNIA